MMRMLLRNTCVKLGMAWTRAFHAEFLEPQDPRGCSQGVQGEASMEEGSRSPPLHQSEHLSFYLVFKWGCAYVFDDKNGFAVKTCWVTAADTCPGSGGRPRMLSTTGKRGTLCTDRPPSRF